MLNDRDLATLTNELQLPMIVSDILDGSCELSDDINYGLHELISEMQPDGALLSIALSAKKIARRYGSLGPSISIISIECDKIIEDYAQSWLDNARNQDIDENQVFDLLSHLPEDLECMTELLENAMITLARHDENASALCEILSIQSSSHALIAETFFETIKMKMNIAYQDTPKVTAPVITAQSYTDNVIQFPIMKINEANSCA